MENQLRDLNKLADKLIVDFSVPKIDFIKAFEVLREAASKVTVTLDNFSKEIQKITWNNEASKLIEDLNQNNFYGGSIRSGKNLRHESQEKAIAELIFLYQHSRSPKLHNEDALKITNDFIQKKLSQGYGFFTAHNIDFSELIEEHKKRIEIINIAGFSTVEAMENLFCYTLPNKIEVQNVIDAFTSFESILCANKNFKPWDKVLDISPTVFPVGLKTHNKLKELYLRKNPAIESSINPNHKIKNQLNLSLKISIWELSK